MVRNNVRVFVWFCTSEQPSTYESHDSEEETRKYGERGRARESVRVTGIGVVCKHRCGIQESVWYTRIGVVHKNRCGISNRCGIQESVWHAYKVLLF